MVGTWLESDSVFSGVTGFWRINLPDCFAPLTIQESDGSWRTFDLLDRNTRVDAYAWLLHLGDETQLFEHLDGTLFVDAWPDDASPGARQRRATLRRGRDHVLPLRMTRNYERGAASVAASVTRHSPCLGRCVHFVLKGADAFDKCVE